MSDFNAKEMIKSLDLAKKQASNLINSLLTPEIMAQLTPEQMQQVKAVKKDMKDLERKDLTSKNQVFKNIKL
jgi:hypothetical protein